MKRSAAVAYARSLLDHPDTDAGIREFAQAYLDLDVLLRSWAKLLIERQTDTQLLSDELEADQFELPPRDRCPTRRL